MRYTLWTEEKRNETLKLAVAAISESCIRYEAGAEPPVFGNDEINRWIEKTGVSKLDFGEMFHDITAEMRDNPKYEMYPVFHLGPRANEVRAVMARNIFEE
ncbi:hypothetical protein M0654_22415 [Rhizobium sp. NTR19]|uniref:Uncharacterized protein n=1 Tax=Neorhizobium turbinariae TaxID=2937795 RepID=A0ABT0IXW2_9HYPH|nr:hypothetical protein [Neorhizobium turbinariae]MCK8782721.1 hypothetical protein [Neorhizobium turbinariae]